ncbi:MAG TPA: hypothetical protein VKR60_11890 [Candidatus Sulfotelmatobacter sp.]|nr:hypothetical protein [Candidatus Sulfotelmatobacter sp.]
MENVGRGDDQGTVRDDNECAAYLPTRAKFVVATLAPPGADKALAPDSNLVNGQRYIFRFRLHMLSPPDTETVRQDIATSKSEFIGLPVGVTWAPEPSVKTKKTRPVYPGYKVQFTYIGRGRDVVSDVANALIAAWQKLDCFGTPSSGTGKLPIATTSVTVLLGRKATCYGWRAKELSMQSPYVQLYAPEDMDALPHTIKYKGAVHTNASVEDRCKDIESVTFTFTGKVRWVRLFADDHDDHPHEVTLSDPLPPAPEPSGWFKRFVQKVQTITEAPGATNIQLQYTSSFNHQQKIGFYSNSLLLVPVGRQDHDGHESHFFGYRWFGISSLIARDNRQVQNPESTINTFTFMTYLNTPEVDCEGKTKPHRPGDILDCPQFQMRPLILDVRTGAEYALDTSAINQVNSAALHLPMALGSMSTVTFSPMGGIETGWNLVREAHLPTSQTFFRWVVGSDASFRHKPPFPWLLGSKPYTLSGIFRARFLTTSEEFIPKEISTQIGTQTSVRYPGRPDRKTRRLYGRAELGIPLSKIVSTAIVYQYGDLPPAFSFFGHTISVAVKIAGPADSER